MNNYFLKNEFVKCPYEYVIYVKIKGSYDTLIVCLYVDDLIFTGNNLKMFEDFKQAMVKEFEMIYIGHMSYYLRIEIKQGEDEIFVNKKKFVKEILKKFKFEDYAKANTLVECRVKMLKNDEIEKINYVAFKRLVESLRYLICTRSDILFGVGLVSKFMKTPTMTHLKALKRRF
jgi:hypothetical protein